MYQTRERFEHESTRGSESSNSILNTYACEFRRIPWTATIGFESAEPFSPAAQILGMPTRGASLKHPSSYFDGVLVVSSFPSLDIESNMRLKERTGL